MTASAAGAANLMDGGDRSTERESLNARIEEGHGPLSALCACRQVQILQNEEAHGTNLLNRFNNEVYIILPMERRTVRKIKGQRA
jgi:hypothetical protein